MDIYKYFDSLISQDKIAMGDYIDDTAVIFWHNTNECFSKEEFIKVNCEYPGKWKGTVEKTYKIDDLITAVVHIYSEDNSYSCHLTSFIKIRDEKIIKLDEYFSEDGEPPKWRRDMKIGKKIR